MVDTIFCSVIIKWHFTYIKLSRVVNDVINVKGTDFFYHIKLIQHFSEASIPFSKHQFYLLRKIYFVIIVKLVYNFLISMIVMCFRRL